MERDITDLSEVCIDGVYGTLTNLSPGQEADTRHFNEPSAGKHEPAMKALTLYRGRQGYDSDDLRHYCYRHRMKPVIAQRKMHRRPRLGLCRGFDKPKYRERNMIERGFRSYGESPRAMTNWFVVFVPWYAWLA